MLRMPFDRNAAKENLADIDLEKILTTFKKPWKKDVFDMKKFSLVQENSPGYHDYLDFIFNDGNYTIRLFYDALPIASIGVVAEKDYLKIIQIQGTPCDDIGSINNSFNKIEQDKMRSIVRSLYWSSALLTFGTVHFFDMGVKDLRVLSCQHNSNNALRKEACDSISRTKEESVFKYNSAFITYDLTALTLGFIPMLPRWKIPQGVDMMDLYFDKAGQPDRKLKFYGISKEDYSDSVIHTLVSGNLMDAGRILRNIEKVIGNYRQKEIHFRTRVKSY